jgi:cytidylate kinase
MNKPADIAGVRNITVSGRIATGTTTLAHNLNEILGWEFLNGGKIFRQFATEKGLDIVQTEARPDEFDLGYEEKIKSLLRQKSHQIIQSHLAGFDAQGIEGIFKILVICEDEKGEDKVDIRIDRLVNRDEKKVEEAKNEIQERERQNLQKWRRLYAKNDPDWVYWDKKYYDLIINTYSISAEDSTKAVLDALKLDK